MVLNVVHSRPPELEPDVPLRASRRIARETARDGQRSAMRERVCQAAMQLFLDEGFERTSMRKIADAVGYTPGAIYAWFENKDDIFFALHNEGFARLRLALQAIDLDVLSPRERLHRVGTVYLRFAFEHPQYYDLMFVTSHTVQKIKEQERWDVGMDTYDFLRSTVDVCLRSGVLPAGDLEAVTFAMWASVHGIAALVIRGRVPMISDDALPRAVEQAYDWTIRALSTRESMLPAARRGKKTRT